MKYRQFGSTDLKVSEIGFGCARLGGIMSAGTDKQAPLNALREAFAAGITFFDTADMYTQGESETLLGKAFKSDRDKVVIASKGGYLLPTQRKLVASIKPLVRPLIKLLGLKRQNVASSVRGTLNQDFSPAYLEGAIEASLRRIGTDYLDLYEVHSPPAEVIRAGIFIETLEKLKRQGKIRYYGVACDTVADALLALQYPGVSSVMFPFGLLDPEGQEELFPLATSQGVGLIARGCFGGGLLKESLTETELKTMDAKWPKIMAYRRLARANKRSVIESALQYSLSFPAISVHLLGMRTPAHIKENLSYYTASPLSSEELVSINEIGRQAVA